MSSFDKILAQADLKIVTHDDPAPVVVDPPVTDPPPADIKPADPPAPVVPDRFKILSETLGSEFKSEEDLTNWKSSLTEKDTKLKDFETRYAALQQEKEELAKSFDPKSLFASDELFVLNGLLKKFPDKNPVVMTEIAARDFSKSHIDSPIEVLALELMLEHPGVYSNKADAEADILANYNVTERDDDDKPVIDAQTKRRMQVAAKTAVDKFTSVKGQIEIPKSVDRSAELAEAKKKEEERIQKMTAATEPLFTKKIPANLKEIEFPVVFKDDNDKEVTEVAFKYEIGEGYAKSKAVKEILDAVRGSAIREGTEWNEAKEAQMEQEVTDLLKANYLFKNRQQVYAAMSEDLQKKFKDEAWVKRHNVRPLKQDGTISKPNSKEEKLSQQQNDFLKARGIKV